MSDQLGTSDIARLLKVSRPRVWQLRKDPTFPEPAGRDEKKREYWYESQILRWAATTKRNLAAPLLFRPTSGKAAYYLGTNMVDGYVILTWDSELGRVCFLYSPRGLDAGRIVGALNELLPKTGADTLVGMDAGFHDFWGPELKAVDKAHPDRQYHPRWADLAQLLGTPVPYWPSELTIPQEMARWRPGTPQIVLPPRHPDLDTGPLLRLVSDSPDGSTVAAAALELARAIDAQAAMGARSDIDLLNEAHDRESITLAATMLEVDEAPEVEEWRLRDGWAEILKRTDRLAEDCIDLALRWNSGRYFPFSSPNDLDPEQSAEAAEFIARLQPCERTAAARVFDTWTADAYWTDPATDLPAITTSRGIAWAATPQRLPALTPLHTVILRDRQVWIRTSDGTLYLAPEDGNGLTWGYRGNGPTILAVLLNRLLDDINAPAVRSVREESPNRGLLRLTQETPQDEGGVFTREQLLAVRDGG